MQSKRSFFNGTLFRKNLSRFWPLWGGVSLAGSLLPLYTLLALLSGAARHLDPLNFSQALYTVAAAAGPVLNFLYAALCAMLVWGYLYNARSVGLMHTLPVDRTCLFVTTTLSGLTMMLIPYAVVGGLMCLIAIFWGFFDLIAAANTVLAILLMAVTFFGLTTFCAMLTGNIFALPVLYLLLNFLAPLLETLLTSLAESFLIGSFGGDGMFTFLSPVLQLYDRLSVEAIRGSGGVVEDYVLHGFGTLTLYGFVGLVLLAVAWVLYRRRHSERAGDIAAFQILRPIFRYGLALLSALTLGRAVYELLWGALFQPGLYAQAVPMGVCMALTGVLGYYAASMMLEKSLRVFRRSLPGVLIVCLGAAVICAAVRMDVFGIERRVPDLEDVEWVQLSGYERTLSYDTYTDAELAERLIDLHQTIVADREYLRDASNDGWYRYFTFTYLLKDGRVFTRGYHLWFTEERLADPGTYDGKMNALLNDPIVIASQVLVPESSELTDVMVYNYDSGYGVESLPEEEQRQIYDALVRDVREGNFPGQDLTEWSTVSFDYYVGLEYRTLDADGSYSHSYNTVYIYPSMEHTVAALIELEYLDQETVDLWIERNGLGGGEIVVP